MNTNVSVQYPVFLSEGKIESASDFINLLFEYALFFRWIYFKNRPRGNLLFVRALCIVGFFGIGFFHFRHDFELLLLGIDIDPVLAMCGAVVAGYWSMLNAFYNKSAACNQIYLEMIKAAGEGNTLTAKLLKNSLAIELLTMDLWAHRRYRMLFAHDLTLAIDHAYVSSDGIDMKLPPTKDDLLKVVNRGKLQSKEVRALLDHYQNHLMNFAAQPRPGQGRAA